MAFDVGPKRRVQPQMNVTPLVDVVLVLLIIFMVITPLMNKAFWVNIPKEEKAPAAAPEPGSGPVVLTVRADGEVRVNDQPVPIEGLGHKLQRILAARTDRVLFFDAAQGARYGRAMDVMDVARGAGATTIAILTEALAK